MFKIFRAIARDALEKCATSRLSASYPMHIACFFPNVLFEGSVPLQNTYCSASNNKWDFRAVSFPDSTRVLGTRCIQDPALVVRDSRVLPDPFGMISFHGFKERVVQRLLESCLSRSGVALHQAVALLMHAETESKVDLPKRRS